jgi:hypothetical protein
MTLAVAGEAERGFGRLRLEPLKNKTSYFFILQLKLQRLLVTRCLSVDVLVVVPLLVTTRG